MENKKILYKVFGLWGSFIGMVVLLSLGIVSLCSFFHFILEHDLPIIEVWIIEHSWEIFLLAQGLSAFLTFKIFNVGATGRHIFKSLLSSGVEHELRDVFVLVSFMVLTIVGLGDVLRNESFQWNIWYLIKAYLYNLIFYCVIIFLCFNLIKKYQSANTSHPILTVIGFWLITFLGHRYFLFFPHNMGAPVCFNLFIIIVLTLFRKPNWTRPFVFVCCFSAPVAIILGLDPMHGAMKSPYFLLRPPGYLYLTVLSFIAVGYLWGGPKKVLKKILQKS